MSELVIPHEDTNILIEQKKNNKWYKQWTNKTENKLRNVERLANPQIQETPEENKLY